MQYWKRLKVIHIIATDRCDMTYQVKNDADILDSILAFVKRAVQSDNTGHDLQHVMRVCDTCDRLGEEENANLQVLRIAALLHDVAISQEVERGADHAIESSLLAKKLLESYNFPKDKIAQIVYAIRVHRFGSGIVPHSIEAKILQDADRLDAMGAIGIARAFSYGGARGAKIYDPEEIPGEYDPAKVRSTITHFREKLLQLKDNMNTKSARRLAEDRHRFMESFLERFLAEINGEL